MYLTPEPFLSAEISYRQQRIAEAFNKHGKRSHGKRRFWVRRRKHLTQPPSRGGVTLVA